MAKEIKTEVELGEYKGNDMVIIHELNEKGERKPYPFMFGKKKAELIVKHIKEIEDFVES